VVCESCSTMQMWIATHDGWKSACFLGENAVPELTVFRRHQPPPTPASVTLLPRKVGEDVCMRPVWDVRACVLIVCVCVRVCTILCVWVCVCADVLDQLVY
jgi:hypothetical protein